MPGVLVHGRLAVPAVDEQERGADRVVSARARLQLSVLARGLP